MASPDQIAQNGLAAPTESRRSLAADAQPHGCTNVESAGAAKPPGGLSWLSFRAVRQAFSVAVPAWNGQHDS